MGDGGLCFGGGDGLWVYGGGVLWGVVAAAMERERERERERVHDVK